MYYHRILVAYIRGVLEAEGVTFSPESSDLTVEEQIAWCEAALEAGLNPYGEKEMRDRIRGLLSKVLLERKITVTRKTYID